MCGGLRRARWLRPKCRVRRDQIGRRLGGQLEIPRQYTISRRTRIAPRTGGEGKGEDDGDKDAMHARSGMGNGEWRMGIGKWEWQWKWQ